jgi:hypothetical protein
MLRSETHPLVKALPVWVAIYIPSYISFYILNEVFAIFPITLGAPWFDNVCVQLMACWWSFFFASIGLWPFTKIKGRIARGLSLLITCWILGLLVWYVYIALLKFDAFTYGFPLIANLFFYITALGYVGENKLVEGLTPPRIFAMNLLMVFGLTWITLSTIVWIPAWWFGLGQILLGTGLFGYLCKDMKQPGKSIAAWCFIAIQVMIMIIILYLLGHWTPGLHYGAFWTIGSPSLPFLVFFAAWCSYNWGILIPSGLWPFTKIKEPWRYIAINLWLIFIAWVVTLFALYVFPLYYPPETALWEAFVWAYIPTNWTFLITLLFPATE